MVTFLAWGGLAFVHYKSRIIPWFINRFTRDKTPTELQQDGKDITISLPLKYDDLRPPKEEKASEDDS
ncbi:hypothetical protein DM15PD_16560 [Aristophania vespae]|nr:hypothetical protein DM15PD_16560 [Aristophania vespae]